MKQINYLNNIICQNWCKRNKKIQVALYLIEKWNLLSKLSLHNMFHAQIVPLANFINIERSNINLTPDF